MPPEQAYKDLLAQTSKVALALTSGEYAKPLERNDDPYWNDHPQYRLAPRMFKHAVAKDHPEFRTGHQQDASEFLQYYLEQLDRAEKGSPLLQPSEGGSLHPSSYLFSFQTTTRMLCTADQKVRYKDSAAETILPLRIPMEKGVVKKDDVGTPDPKRLKPSDNDDDKEIPTVTLTDCLEAWASENTVDDIRWAHLDHAMHPTVQTTRLTNFPRYLVLQAQRYTIGPDWTPLKLEVRLEVPEDLDLSEYKSAGPQDNEVLVPDDVEESAPTAAHSTASIDEAALAQLMDMGFSLNSCKRALNAVGGSNVEAAMGWVFEHNTDPDFNDPLPDTAAAADSSGVDEGVVQSLVESLGCFTADQVRAALQETSGVADRAADWLFSHMDDLDTAIAALSDKNAASASRSSGPSIPLEDGEGKYSLMGMVSHIGKNTGSGHYVAHIKKDGQWVIFNDEKVAYSEKPPFEHAFLYFFQRTDTIGKPHDKY